MRVHYKTTTFITIQIPLMIQSMFFLKNLYFPITLFFSVPLRLPL